MIPNAQTGVFSIDPDGTGSNAAFDVYCDMSTMAGGWTLVGLELLGANASDAGPLRLLDQDSMNSPMIAAGTQGGIIGVRFVGMYSEVLITWGTDYIHFDAPSNYELFGNVLDYSVPLTNFSTSNANLTSWVNGDGGAKFCNASHDPDIDPGNSTWAVKPQLDDNTGCGCNSTGWAGRGAYYGGANEAEVTICNGWGGAWAGVQDNGDAKAGLAPMAVTRIYIR